MICKGLGRTVVAVGLMIGELGHENELVSLKWVRMCDPIQEDNRLSKAERH